MNTEYTYIVTGCTGFVGNVLTKKLLEEGCSVVGLARSEQKAVRVFGENAPKMVYGDITDSKAAEELFCGNKPFVVIHTVAKVSIGESSAQELYDVTVNGTKNVVKASLQHDVKKFIHISSTEALPRGMKQGERYIPDPKKSRKGYARTKSEADAVVLRAAENGLNASILLFASVLGPGDYGNGHMSQMFSDFLGGRLPASVRAGYNDFDIRDGEITFRVAGSIGDIIIGPKYCKYLFYCAMSSCVQFGRILRDFAAGRLGFEQAMSFIYGHGAE